MPEKTAKPQIEETINDVLHGDALKNALDFVAFLRANKLSPRWASLNSWAVSYKNQRVCYIRLSGTAHYHNLEDGSWHINHVNYGQTELVGDDDEQYISNERLKDMVWNNVKYCAKCYNCKPGNVVTVLGRQFDEVCHSWLMMKNPDVDTLNCAKTIILMRKKAIANID
ncbi:MAG: hypothetical protein FWC73_07705 [Defluviitaleaceae bacterium]|nr:hypothetical protein [Defluviitaleaceae bacterium]